VSLFNVLTASLLEDITQTANPSLIEGLIVRDTLVADFTGDGLDDIFLNAHGTEGVNPFPGYQNKLMVQNQMVILSSSRTDYRRSQILAMAAISGISMVTATWTCLSIIWGTTRGILVTSY
ncbi:MAG: hypothetical protein P8M13_07500, partial [Luminiphilus sp.]|nr:hypothetical protein [Luminiphilus sp.]